MLDQVGVMLAHFSLLVAFFPMLGASGAFPGRFWLLLVVFSAFWTVSGWILERSGTLRGGFGDPKALFFEVF